MIRLNIDRNKMHCINGNSKIDLNGNGYTHGTNGTNGTNGSHKNGIGVCKDEDL